MADSAHDSIVSRTLGNGMPLLLENMPGVRSVGLTWLVPAGSSTDPASKQGLSTMWSELLIRGAGELDSRTQADALDQLGLSRGAEVTTHHLRLSATMLGSRLRESLPLLVDMVRRPRMEENAIEPTRDLALQSLESLKDDPTERAMVLLKERHNPPPLNRSGLGTSAGIGAITRDDLVAGWARQARPGQLFDHRVGWGTQSAGATGSILAIAGDLGSAGGVNQIIDDVEKLLAGWSGSPPRVVHETSKTKGTYHHVEDASAQVQIALMHDAPREAHSDSRLERVLTTVLSGGMSARLFTEVREKRGLCYSVNASYAADRDAGRGIAYVGTTPERAQESLDVLLSELHRVNTPAGAITQEEFDRAMIGIKASIIFSGESTSARAGALAGDQFRLGRPRSLDEVVDKYATITLDELNSYLARRKLDQITIVTLGPAALKRPA